MTPNIYAFRNIYALLVGIDQYANPEDRLHGCVNDIEEVEKFLRNRLDERYSPHIEKLIDEQATRQAVINKFENHLCQAGKDDVVLFYFCGHGSQELAGLEFDALEYEKEVGKKKLETIVCHDSRTKGEDGTEIRDLADKELRYLIAKVAKNEPHILVVFDCCHSSSGTRDTDRKERVRRLPTDTRPPRAYNEFCFARDSAIVQNLKQGIFPEGKHVFMSACLHTETAKEIDDEDGKGRGVFSYFLLRELNSLNAALSYHDLLNEVKGHVHGRRRDQTPQLEPIGMSSQDLNSIAFLGDREVIRPREPYFNLIYRHEIQDRQSAEWIVTGGVSQFLQEGSELAVYPENCTLDEMKDKSRKLGDVRITAVRMEESAITFISEPEPPKDSSYKAVLTKRPLPTVRFYLEGDTAALAQVEEKLANSLVVGIERNRSKPHQYRLYAREQQFEITDADDRLLVVPIEGNGEYDVNKAVKQVEHIARWTKTRQLENPNSSIPKNAIDIEITYNDEVYTNSDLRLEYVGKESPKIRLKLKNTLDRQLDQPLYCAILDISDSYAVSILKVFPEGGDGTWICLNPKQEYQARARSGANFIGEIPFGMPKEVINQGLTEYQDVLKLIVSTEAFTTLSQFEQNSLLLADQKSREMLTDPPVADWMTKQITLTTVRAKDSVKLIPQTETVLSAGVRIMAPPGLQATAHLKPPSSTTRSVSSIGLPALLDNTEAFQFSTSRSVRQNVSVLELEVNPSTLDAVKPDSPMIISVDRPLQPNERVLAVAHDGQFYFPLGVGQADNGKTEIKIERLCDPLPLNTDERELRQAIQLCFRKVVLDNVGQKSSYAWLRKATLNGDGTVSYTDKGDVDAVKAAVAKANNIVLYIHGIIGDTESMIPSVRYAKVNANGQVKSLEELYDLVLAFDYESLNTSIEATARELKRQLAAVGLEPNHGKRLHILAHSMGGLVSRSFIEQGNGNEVVSHLIMVGTPNGGSPWATVHDLATTLLSFGLNLSSVPIVPSLLEKLVEAMSVTLREMHSTKSSFVDELKTFADPRCPYSIIAGSTALMDRASEVKQLLDALKRKMRRAIELPFGDEENDIAVAVTSIIDVPKDRSPAVYTPAPIACDHLSYFRQSEGLHAIASVVGRAFGYPPEPLPPSRSSSPPGPRPNPSPVSSGKTGAQPTGTGSTNTPTESTPRSSASTDGNSSVSANILEYQTPASSPQESAPVSPQSNPNHETRTTKWFDTTHVVAIGVNDYKKPIASLDNAVNDATSIYNLFDEKCLCSGEIIKKYKLLNEEATLDGIRQQLESLKTEVTENDRLIFYYAGHGIALHSQESTESDPNLQNPDKGESNQKQKNKPRGYLIPHDADMEGRKNYLSMEALLDWLGNIQCRHCLIILDCCYAGSIQWSLDKTREILLEKVYPTVLDNYINKKAWFILTSSDENEKAKDGEPIELNPEEQLKKNTRGSGMTSNSPFLRFLKQALSDGEADIYPRDKKDNIITSAELETYLVGEVTNAVSRISGEESRQTPQRFKVTGKHGGGEFVFLLNEFETIKKQLPEDPDITADDKHNPYRGLDSFTEENKHYFFGRERVTKQLFDHVRARQLTVVVSASGAGKSSLVNAGLIPKFKEESKKAVASQSSNSDEVTQQPDSKQNAPQELNIVVEMRPGQSPPNVLNKKLEDLKKLPAGTECLLIIDQFEEIETQCRNEEERKQFWNILIERLKNAPKSWHIVLILRANFEAIVRGKFESAIKEYKQPKTNKSSFNPFGISKQANHSSETNNAAPEFTLDWVAARLIVPAMEREDLQAAIEKPAKEVVVFFTSEPDPQGRIQRTLVQELVHEVAGMPGALPLLSFALYTMYRDFAQEYVKSNKTIKREITWNNYYNSLGGNGVPGALTKRATEEYKNLAFQFDEIEENGKKIIEVKKNDQGEPLKEEASIAQARQEMLKWLMLRMVTLDSGQVARRRVFKEELQYDKHYNPTKSKQLDRVIQLFDQARLLVQGKVEVIKIKDDGSQITEEKEYVEPAHDALILNWDLLKQWIEEEKENIILRDRVIPDVHDWQRLRKAEKPSNWKQHLLNLPGTAVDRLVEQLRVKGELKRLNKQENAGQKQRVAASKNGHSSDENTKATAQETAKSASEILPSTHQAITLQVSSHLPENGHSSENNATVTAQETAQQGHANLTSQETKAEKAPSQTHSENRQHPKSSDRLWDKESRLEVLGQQLGNLRTSKESWLNKTEADFVLQSLIKREKGRAIWKFVFFVIVLSLSGLTARVLNEQRNTLIEQIRTSRQSAEANLQANRDLEALTDILRARKTFDNWLLSILPTKQEFNIIPYTSWVHVGNSDVERTQVRGILYKAIYATKERNRFQLDRGVINSVALHPTKNLLASAGNRGTIRLYDTITKKQLQQFPADQNVQALAFTPDGEWLATGGGKKIKFWRLLDNRNIDTSEPSQIQEAEQGVIDITFNPNNNRVATVTDNYKVQLWKFEKPENKEGKPNLEFQGANFNPDEPIKPKQQLYGVAFRKTKNKDQQDQLVTVGISDEITLWNTANDKFIELNKIKTKQTNVHSVAFTKNGELATGGEDKTVKFWEIKGQNDIKPKPKSFIPFLKEQQKVFKTPPKNIYGMAFGANDELAIFGEDEAVTLFNNSGTSDKPIQPQDTYVNDAIAGNMAYSPDGSKVALIAGGNTIRLWDIKSGKQLRRFSIITKEYGDAAISLAFSPSGKEFVVGTDQGFIMLYNASGDLLALKYPQWSSKNGASEQVAIQRVMFIPDSSTLAVYGKRKNVNDKSSNELFLGYYSVENQALNKFSQDQNKTNYSQDQNKTNKSSIKDFVFDSKLDRLLVIAKEDKNTVYLWNTNKMKPPKPPIKIQNKVNSVAFSPDDKFFATAGQNGEVKLWEINELNNQKKPQPFLTLPTNQKNIKSLVFNPLDSNSLLTGGEDGTVRAWDISGNKPTQLSVEGQKINLAAFSSDNELLATINEKGKLLMWKWDGHRFKPKNISQTDLGKFQETPEVQFGFVAFRPKSNHLITVGKDFTVKMWDIEGNYLGQLDENETKQQVSWVTWSGDGTLLATVEVITPDKNQCGSENKKPKPGNKVKLWEFKDNSKFNPILLNKKPKYDLEKFQNQKVICSIALSFDGKQLATTESKPQSGRTRLWDTSQGNKISEFQTQQGKIESVAFNPHGDRLVTVGGNRRTLRLWDVSGNLLALIQENKINRARFSTDGRLLAGIRDGDSQLMVWDVSGNKFNLLYGQKSDQKFGVKAFEFNANGQLATVGEDGKVSLWQINEEQLLAQACNLVRGYLETNPNVAESDRELCKDVQPEPINQDISAGNKILVARLNNPDKLAGVEEIDRGDFAGAIEPLKASLKSHPNDPEARIYLNNALIGNQNSYTIAVPVPLSSNPDGAAEILRGVAQAQKELNENGGINGTLLRVLIADDQGDPEVAKQVAKQISENADVLGVVGHFTSDATRKAGEIYKQKQLVAISPVSTAVDSAGLLSFNRHIFGNPYLFRTVPNDRQSAQALARYLLEQLKHEKAVVFFNSNSEYSKSLSSEFAKAFGDRGGQVVQKFDVSEPDFNPSQQVQEAINSGAQALVLLTDTSKLDATLQVVKANGLLSRQENRQPLSLLAGDDIYTLKTLQQGRADTVGMTLAVPWHIDSNRKFANAASSLWKATVNWRTAMAYDATQAFIEALRQNSTRECIAQAPETKDARKCIAQRLRSKDFSVGNGASGQIQFEQSGDRAQESQLVEVVESDSNSRSKTGYDFAVAGQLPLTDAERNKLQPSPQNAPSPTPSSNNRQNSYKPSISNSRQASKLNSTSVDTYINQGLTYHRQGNYQQAISNLNKAIALNPNSAKAYSNRAAVYNQHKDYQKAIADSSKAISLNPTYANAYINRGVAYYHQGNSQQAIANYNKAIKLAPGNAIAYTNRALAYTRLGNQQAAQADRQKAAELSQQRSK
jgi:ABC-type branched-subunit amino acid transport system substrate-binding protein/WD40 repeat protein/Flp pilus assembly protein TadD/pimeloyl-ACP methyl ester carboxylesterase